MKLFWITVLLVLDLQAFEYGLKPSQVSDRIYCFFGLPQAMNKHNNGNMVNSCFVDMDTSWLVIDSGPTFNYAKEAFLRINKIKKQPVSYVINTHIHDDHWLGNGFYKQLGATIVGSKMFQTAINPNETTRMQSRITAQAFENTKISLPTQMINEDLDLMLNHKKVSIIVLKEKNHTSSDLLVNIPSLNALFTGDLIFSDRLPSARDGNILVWIKQLEAMEAKGYTYIIGGHGNKTNRQATLLTKGYLTALKSGIKEALEKGYGIGETVKSLELDDYTEIPMYEALHKQNVEAAYRVMEWEDE